MSSARRKPPASRRSGFARSALAPAEWRELRVARAWLEHPSLAARISNVIGGPLENALKLLPHTWSDRIHHAAELAIRGALTTSIATLPGSTGTGGRGSHDSLHRGLSGATGAAGGFFGLPGLVVELPVTTLLMLRSIADIARAQGEDLDDADARMACVHVFAYGSRAVDDDAAETGYYGIRFALASHFSTAAIGRSLGRNVETLPASLAIVRAIAARFGITVSDKAAAQMVPVLGALSGALINMLFMQHFQQMAYGHFTVRRLERRYGTPAIQRAYESIRDEPVRQALAAPQ